MAKEFQSCPVCIAANRYAALFCHRCGSNLKTGSVMRRVTDPILKFHLERCSEERSDHISVRVSTLIDIIEELVDYRTKNRENI